MGIFYALKQATQGNFQNAFNGLFSSDDLLAAQDAVGDNLSKKIAQQQASGLISEEEAGNLYSIMAPNTNSTAYWEGSGDSPLNVFEKTISERASAIGQFGSSAVNRTLGLGFRVIPWQVYILGLVLLAIWLYPIWKPFAVAYLKRGK